MKPPSPLRPQAVLDDAAEAAMRVHDAARRQNAGVLRVRVPVELE